MQGLSSETDALFVPTGDLFLDMEALLEMRVLTGARDGSGRASTDADSAPGKQWRNSSKNRAFWGLTQVQYRTSCGAQCGGPLESSAGANSDSQKQRTEKFVGN
jgi:hypothetical protein